MLNVVIVDDDHMVLQVYAQAMDVAGHASIVFDCPQQALKYVREYGADVDMIITDFHMPRMNGLEFIHEVRELGYDMPIIISSGYVEEVDLDQTAIYNARVVAKPVRMPTLINLVQSFQV